jgi:hypothetical protein
VIYRSTYQGIFLKILLLEVDILAAEASYCIFGEKLSIITQENPVYAQNS